MVRKSLRIGDGDLSAAAHRAHFAADFDDALRKDARFLGVSKNYQLMSHRCVHVAVLRGR